LVSDQPLVNPVPNYDGQEITIRVKQGDALGRKLTFGALYKFNPTYPAPVSGSWSVGVGLIDIFSFRYNATDNRWDCIEQIYGA
jgi:hypothetical protein